MKINIRNLVKSEFNKNQRFCFLIILNYLGCFIFFLFSLLLEFEQINIYNKMLKQFASSYLPTALQLIFYKEKVNLATSYPFSTFWYLYTEKFFNS